MIILADKHGQQPSAASIAEGLLSTTVKTIASRPLSSYFFDTTFVQVPKTNSLNTLSTRLHERASVVRQRRREAGLLFSVEHFNTLFERAFESATALQDHPFDPICSARQDLPVSTELADHLLNFMNQIPLATDLLSFASPVVASSFLLDHYVPDMHLFNPADVFERLYRDACRRACRRTVATARNDGLLLPSALINAILDQFLVVFDRLKQGEAAVSIHRSILAAHSDHWPSLKNNKSCFSCLTQVPQHKISCGHWICENCLQAFGTSDAADPLLFSLKQCLLDGQVANLEVRIRPPTAGHSILCIDGGGVRGIIPPAILRQIQERLDLPIPIQELFTMSSLRQSSNPSASGALIVLALFVNGWSVEQCAVEFEQLAKVAFSPPAILSLPGLSWARSILLDAIYSENDIETALKKAFGEKTLTETPHAKRIGARIGIPAATIRQPSLCLFTNYNGVGQERSGYSVLKEAEHVKTWEIGRSSSAAPLYFTPKYLSGLGTFQDAGTLVNNPIIVALSEFAAMYGDGKPDLVLNIGTGTSPDMPVEDERPRFIKDSWLVRLKRGYMALMQGRKTWNDVASLSKRVGESSGRYRLDVTLPQPPSLDDTASMPMLTSLVHRDTVTLRAVPEIAHHMFATLFYFELDSMPKTMGSNLRVNGRILCIRKGQDQALPKILERLRKSTLYVNGKSTPSVIDTDIHGNIHHTIDFITGKSLLIELEEEDSRHPFPISGSPYNISKLVSCGQATAVFGTRSHQKRPLE
ncbi:patatin phospholipase, partial [Fusarium albosuccineum]